MKASDLMIGDYILVKPSMMPIQVAAVHNKKIGYHAATHKLNWVREGLLEPIPITPEILEKNGIRYQFGHPWWQAAEMEDGVFEIHLTEKSTMLLKYVHQLQHALKLCGISKNIEP